ncbi:MAG: ASCH domain-containing protein [Phycisphaeraceae bacterium]
MKTWKALTICQPYAHLIMAGEKLVENRTWPTRYRGPLVIHAGKSRAWLDSWDQPVPEDMPFGAVVGWVRLVDCVRLGGELPEKLAWLREHEHASGPWCWVLADPHPAPKPLPYRGRQGLYEIPAADLQNLRQEARS